MKSGLSGVFNKSNVLAKNLDILVYKLIMSYYQQISQNIDYIKGYVSRTEI